MQSCAMAHVLWQTLMSTYEKKKAVTKIYLIPRLYNLLIKESDSVNGTSLCI